MWRGDTLTVVLRGKGIATHFAKYYLFDGTGRNSLLLLGVPFYMHRMGKVARER
jgi:hypothetical protein